jgi:hypothetical protein
MLGDVTFSGADGVTLTQVASDIQISAPALSSTTPSKVGASGSVGVGTTSARADHAHEGLHSALLSGNPVIVGDLTIGVNGGLSGSQVGNTITLSAPALSSTAALSVGASNAAGTGTATAREDHVHRGVSSVAKNGASQLFGDVTLSAGANVTLTQVGNDISISSSGGGGSGLSGATPQSVGGTASAGVGTLASRDDHVHAGLHSISKSGSAQILGDATLTGSNGISLTQASNNIDVSGAALLPLAGGTMTGNITLSTGVGSLTSGGLVVGNFLTQRLFTSGTTYTPTTGTRLIVVELIGGGGGGAGIDVAAATDMQLGGGGGGGGYTRFLFRDISGLTGTYSIGTGGTAGSSAGGSGGTGGTTSFTMDGYTINALGGAGGTEGAAGLYTVVSTSAAGGSTSTSGTVSTKYTAILTRTGQASAEGIAAWTRNGDNSSTNVIVIGGTGGAPGFAFYGNTVRVENAGGTDAGEAGPTFGSGGNGARVVKNTTGSAGGAGGAGAIIITEYA